MQTLKKKKAAEKHDVVWLQVNVWRSPLLSSSEVCAAEGTVILDKCPAYPS